MSKDEEERFEARESWFAANTNYKSRITNSRITNHIFYQFLSVLICG